MKKIIVIGCPGSGKTTFAEKLRDKTGLPLFYLDAIWHKPDRTHVSREEYDTRLSEILALDSLIMQTLACLSMLMKHWDLPKRTAAMFWLARLN